MDDPPSGPVRGEVLSADGTRLRYECFAASGSAHAGRTPPATVPALVVCHGAYSSAADWRRVARALSATRPVFLYNRRGHGAAPDGEDGCPYALAREMDDLAAMVALAGPEAAVLGHSFGGGCALAWALRDGFAGRLVLYEPVHSMDRPMSGGQLPALRALLLSGEADRATAFALERIVGTEAGKVDLLRLSPLWPGMVAQTPLFLREAEALDTIAPTAEALVALRARTWLLLGERSAVEPARRCLAALVQALPRPMLRTLPGQGHVAQVMNPLLVARVVEQCFAEG